MNQRLHDELEEQLADKKLRKHDTLTIEVGDLAIVDQEAFARLITEGQERLRRELSDRYPGVEVEVQVKLSTVQKCAPEPFLDPHLVAQVTAKPTNG